MKNKIILLSMIAVVLFSCNKDPKISDKKQEIDSIHIQKNTSIPNSNIGIIQEEKPNNGSIYFTQNDKIFLVFNPLENQGKIIIDGKEVPLNHLEFTENNYNVGGENISISAENGEFEEACECPKGFFPVININYNGRKIDLTNVTVEGCSLENRN